jgi:hypothetical protein
MRPTALLCRRASCGLGFCAMSRLEASADLNEITPADDGCCQRRKPFSMPKNLPLILSPLSRFNFSVRLTCAAGIFLEGALVRAGARSRAGVTGCAIAEAKSPNSNTKANGRRLSFINWKVPVIEREAQQRGGGGKSGAKITTRPRSVFGLIAL